MPFRVLIASICYGSYQRCEITPWCIEAYCAFDRKDVVTNYLKMDQLYVESARNKAVSIAQSMNCDALVMVDSDMLPAMGFFKHAIEFLRDRAGPVVIASPYCGSPLNGCPVHVQRSPDGKSVVPVTRDEAAMLTGNEQVAAIGTGLMAIHLDCFDVIGQPYFAVEYASSSQDVVLLTEDYYFCQKLGQMGGQVWVSWDHWSGHDKHFIVQRPKVGEQTFDLP